MKTHLHTLAFLAALFVASSGIMRAGETPAKPNILWIIMDDVGAEVPCYGERSIQTPHIDRLVREGVKFDQNNNA